MTSRAKGGIDPVGASFRDPAGRLVVANERLLRIINEHGAVDFKAFRDSECAARWQEDGWLTSAEPVDWPDGLEGADAAALVVEHAPIAFPSYPVEWPPEMLHAAGELTLTLCTEALVEGFGLKDATPYNVLFRDAAPVFIDWLSFEKRKPLDPMWLPQAQFQRTFLLPLLLARYLDLHLSQVFLAHRDGLEPAQAYAMTSWLLRLRPPFLGLASLPTWLSGRAERSPDALYRPREVSDPPKARFILELTFKRLRKQLARAAPCTGKTSSWSTYMEAHPSHYGAQNFSEKERFVKSVLAALEPARVLDVGSNTGHFSALSASAGADVVAIDSDPVVVGELWRRARGEHLNILPLVVDLTRPTPALGWRNAECPSFLDRASGVFDLVLFLAVIHHMMVSEGIPLEEVVALAAVLTTEAVVMEYVGPADPMFRRVARGREELHAQLSPEVFEGVCARHFEIVRRQYLEGSDRILYLLRKRA